MVSLRDIAPFQRLNRADDRWSFSWDTGAGENALVGAQSVSRRNGFDLRDREYVQVGVYRVCATGKISLTASWSFEWIFEWRDQRSGPGSGNLSLWPELDKRTFVKSLATIFVTTKLSQLAAISTWNLLNWYTIKLSVLVLLFSLTGFYAGLKTQDRVDQAVFNRGLLVLLALIGLLLIVRAGTQGS